MQIVKFTGLVFWLFCTMACASTLVGHRHSRSPSADSGPCPTDQVRQAKLKLEERLKSAEGFNGIGITFCNKDDLRVAAGLSPSSEPAESSCGVVVDFDSQDHLNQFARTYLSDGEQNQNIPVCGKVQSAPQLQ